jgi:tetratricopeptide (TPR) repeat protein
MSEAPNLSIKFETVPLDKCGIQFFGMRRSGNHAIIDWMMEWFNFDKYHYNNIQLYSGGKCEVVRDHIDFCAGRPDKEFHLASFEDYWPQYVKRHLKREWIGRADSNIVMTNLREDLSGYENLGVAMATPQRIVSVAQRIGVIRDPFNMVASRLQKVRNSKDKTHVVANKINENIMSTWKEYAKEALGHQNVMGCKFINFNLWCQDKDYREKCSELIVELPFNYTDKGYGSRLGWRYSGGSSFNDSDQLDVLNRWKVFKDDEEYLFFFDDETIELAKELFGEVPDIKFHQKMSIVKKPYVGAGGIALEDLELHGAEMVDKAINTATLLCKQARDDEAEEIIKQALKVSPDNPRLFQLLSVCQHNLNRSDEALETLKEAIKNDPTCAEHHNNIGMCYHTLGDIKKALEHGKRAIELDDSQAAFWNNLGLHYKRSGNVKSAIDSFKKSLKLADDPYVLVNLGSAHSDLATVESLEKASSCYQTVIDQKTGISGAHVNLAYCLQTAGKWKEGWKEYEYRLSHYPQMLAYLGKYDEDKKWNGKDSLSGKKVVVFCEQGMGDSIHFSRYLSSLKARGCHITLSCYLKLSSLFEKMSEVDDIIYKDVSTDLPEFDYHIPLMSLPYLLELHDPLPLKDKPFAIKHNALKLNSGSFLNPKHNNDWRRSMNLSDLNKLFQIKDCAFFSLQKEHGEKNPSLYKSAKINCEPIQLAEDFGDTAEIISGLDLVVSVDTSVLHLAGSMDVPTIGLIPFKPDWRWGLNTNKTVWYPSMTLIRQEESNDWSSIVDKLCETVEVLKKEFFKN